MCKFREDQRGVKDNVTINGPVVDVFLREDWAQEHTKGAAFQRGSGEFYLSNHKSENNMKEGCLLVGFIYNES